MAAASLGASGALLGIAAAHPIRRSLPPAWRQAGVAAAGAAGALLFSRAIESMMGLPAGEIAPLGPVLLTALVVALVAALVLGRTGALDDEVAASPASTALALIALGFVPLANVLTTHAYAPWFSFVALYWVAVGGAVMIVLVAIAALFPAFTTRLWQVVAERAMRVPSRVFVGVAALFAVAAAAALFVFCFALQPQDVDEAAQLWHAKILLAGHLTLPRDPNAEFFMMDDMISGARWYSQYPIGGPAFVALGMATGAAWLLNPVLIGLTVIGVYTFARRAYGEGVARASAALFALAPFPLFVGASYMNCVPVLWLASVAMTQLAVWADAESGRDLARSAALVGLSIGTAVTVRPLDGIVLALVIGGMQLACAGRNAARWRSLAWGAAAGLVPLALLCYVNARTNGAPFRLGYEILYGDATRLGFHVDPYGVPHTPIRALAYTSKYLLQLSLTLFEWPVPALGVLVAGLLVLRRPSRWDYFLLALLGVQIVAYALYWFNGVFRGPRYLFTALPAVVILVARAPFLITERSRGVARRVAPLALPVFVLLTWLVVPSRASVAGRARAYRRETSLPARVDPAQLASRHGLHRAVVFVNEDSRNRALRQLWALGLRQGDALQLLASGPVCASRLAIDAEHARAGVTSEGRLQRLEHDIASFDPSAPLPAACADDLRRDQAGTATYRQFLAANSIDDRGRVDGDVVYVLDLGPRNELLRSRFGDRAWYRFGTRTSAADPTPDLRPY